VTLHECADAAARLLVEAGAPAGEARQDASVLARHCLGWTRAAWATRNREPAPPDVQARLFGLARRPAARLPGAYHTGGRGL
jgi:hypothetical protein